MRFRQTLARTLAIAALGASLAGCSMFHLPHLLGGGRSRAQAQAAKGERIPVLGLTQTLQPAPALKGVEFALPAPEPQPAWPVPGGTPAQSVENVQAAPAFQIAWRRKVGVGQSRATHVTAPPIAADGHIFVMDGQAGVSAWDESGREIWRVNLANKRGRDRESYGGGLAFADGTVFVTSGYRFVAALDSRTGAVKWRTDTASPIHGAPNVLGGRVYAEDVQDQLFAFDAATGQQVWAYQALEEPARMMEASSPALTEDVLVAPFASGELIALNPANGNDIWSDVLSLTSRNNALSEIRDIGGRPVIYRGDVLAGSHSGVFTAIDIHTGQRRWAQPISTITSPWPAGDVVFVTDLSGQVICLARDSGQVYWIVDLNRGLKKKQRATWSGPMLASNRLILVSDKGQAIALNPRTGAQTASLKLGTPVFLSPMAANGTIYVLSEQAELIAIR